MDLQHSIFAIAALALTLGTAQAQTPYPSHDVMAPGSNAVGTPDYGASVKVKGSTGPASPDKNGDGFIDSTEIEPGSQLAKRLQTRDANGDGKLSRDEYYFK